MDGFHPCFFCGKPATDVHHCFGGANRPKSEKYGLVVCLCRGCHDKVHFGNDRSMMDELHKYGQRLFNAKYPELDFAKIFHRNYLEEGDSKCLDSISL